MPTLQIHGDKFEIMIFRRGRLVRWQEATICSCWDNQSGNPSFSCKACRGVGYTYGTAPYDGQALVTSITSDKEYQDSGAFQAGDAIMTVPRRYPVKLSNGNIDNTLFTANPMFDIGMYDLVTLLDDEYKTSEVLTKGVERRGVAADTLLNATITRIKQVRKVVSTTGVVTTYLQGTDFLLNGNVIQWIGTNKPNVGENYSVVYFHRPIYRVFTTLPKPRHQDGQDLPRYVALRYYMGGLT
jgi:hypothetical protein